MRRDDGWLRHIGLLNDYVNIPYATGSTFASQFLRREFLARGHEVTVVGPDDPGALDADLPQPHVMLPALPFRIHPGVRLPFPTPRGLARVAAKRFDLVLGQTNTELTELGVWLRATQHVPFLCVNTMHMGAAYNVMLPDQLLRNQFVNGLFETKLIPWVERVAAQVYNQSDGLIVLADGLERFWRSRGVTVPIHVIPRSVEPKVFDAPAGDDPFDPRAARGRRLLVVCRQTREKGVARLLEIFARHIQPQLEGVSLTLVGDGPDYDSFRAQAERLGVAHCTFFPGEHSLTDIPRFYGHADLFVYTSLSETYGQVISEAMWCGLPVVAFADDMGVSAQVRDGVTGHLVRPGPDQAAADRAFAERVLGCFARPERLAGLKLRAEKDARSRAHPARIVARYYDAFEQAREHCAETMEARIAHPLAGWSTLGRWTAVQSLAAGLGLIRRPAVVNRHGRRQPAWADALPPAPGPRADAAQPFAEGVAR
jgi:1,2-diacylglycerol 3-alpha-glucosyltransferase